MEGGPLGHRRAELPLPRRRWFPSLNVIIRDNLVEDIGGDGIVPWATDGAIVEHNIARHCNRRAATYDAGIWPWSTDNSLFQLNEAAFTHGTTDGEGFDSDYNSRNTLFQYNYGHDNEGGFMLICTPGDRRPEENLGNMGTLVRYNISRNDRARIFHLSGAEKTTVEHNAVYIGPGLDVQMLLVTNWKGWADGAVFRDNVFTRRAVRYGHDVGRTDGRIPDRRRLGSGEGHRVRRKSLCRATGRPSGRRRGRDRGIRPAPKLEWNGPQFDPARPDGFDAFLEHHRQWMLRLFQAQFGHVRLGR